MSVKAGDKVVFGRKQGEKTRGTVIRVSRSSVTVRQDESRGSMRVYPVGTKWRVDPRFVKKVSPKTSSATRASGASPKKKKIPIGFGPSKRVDIPIGDGVLTIFDVGPYYYTTRVSAPPFGKSAEYLLASKYGNEAVAEALEVLYGAAEMFMYGGLEDYAPRISEKAARSKFVRDVSEWAYENASEIEQAMASI